MTTGIAFAAKFDQIHKAEGEIRQADGRGDMGRPPADEGVIEPKGCSQYRRPVPFSRSENYRTWN